MSDIFLSFKASSDAYMLIETEYAISKDKITLIRKSSTTGNACIMLDSGITLHTSVPYEEFLQVFRVFPIVKKEE